MLKNCAMIFGVVLTIIGILGFIPTVTPHGHLLGLFHVNREHNLVHLLTGIAGIACSFVSTAAARLFFQIFGVVYTLIALLGFYYVDRPIFGILANNMADVFLHIAIAAVSLYFGFAYHDPNTRVGERNRM